MSQNLAKGDKTFMKETTKMLLFWIPRILATLFAMLLSLFAMDAFNEKLGLLQQIKEFLIHLIPAFFILLILCLAWRWELIGAVSYFVLAICYLFSTWGRFPLSVYFVIVAPLLIVSFLFFVNWFYHDELKNRFSF